MTQEKIKEKISYLERELEFLKHEIFREPDFEIDEKIWRKIRPAVKKIRKRLYQKLYGKK